jgi:hypothetical protein
MTSNTHITFAGRMQILVVWGVVNPVARATVHRHIAARVASLLAKRVRYTVFVGVALAAKLDLL